MYNNSSFNNSRNQKLYTASWLPDDGVIKANLIWVHGYGEYVDRWSKVFGMLVAQGIAVFGHDHHGMGKSEPSEPGKRGLVLKFSDLVDDTTAFLDLVETQLLGSNNTAPLFIGGNSLGGLISCHVALRRQEKLSGLLLVSPALDVEWTPILRIQAMVGDLLANLIPKAKLVPAVRPEDMSQDPSVVNDYINDKLILHGNLRARTGNESLKGFRALTALRAQLALPVLAVMGTHDRCTSLPALREFIGAISSTDRELREIPGGFHELCMGPERDEVVAAAAAWLLARGVKSLEAQRGAEGRGEAEGATPSAAVAAAGDGGEEKGEEREGSNANANANASQPSGKL